MDGIYFLHIPKTAGVSVGRLLEAEFGEALCPAKTLDALLSTPREARDAATAFAGHFGVWLPDIVGRRFRTFTLLRDPVARTVSHYRHVKRDPNHPYHRYVQDQSLAEFVSDPVTAWMSCNFQARYLARSVSPLELAGRFDQADFERSRLSVTWEAATLGASDERLAEAAAATLASLDFVGVTEAFSAGHEAIRAKFGFGAHPIEHLNAAPDPPDRIDEPTLDLIRRRTAVDADLYRSVAPAPEL